METPKKELRRGWTTGACATAAVKAALEALWGAGFPEAVTILLPRGETPTFPVAYMERGGEGASAWAEAGVVKDAGDDPDVTHGALIRAKVRAVGNRLQFKAGEGVGTVTKPGLPIAPGEPAINPVPREMMAHVALEQAERFGRVSRSFVQNTYGENGVLYKTPPSKTGFCTKLEAENAGFGLEITITIPGGEKLAAKTWNPRLGITGGLSVLGTTGVVRPFSCSAWIASIHRGVDVARASGETHVAGCTGATSEAAVRALYDLPEHAMLDMGDFAGGMLKYLARHPVARVTIGGGIAKMAKLGQGALDLHSGRSQVDFEALAALTGAPEIAGMNTVLEAYEAQGVALAQKVAAAALATVEARFGQDGMAFDVVIVDRAGTVVARAGAGSEGVGSAGPGGGSEGTAS